MEQLMIEKMVKDRMPTSSADYIIRKAAQSSLFGLPYELNKSPLAAEIEAKGEAAYKPSRTEKAAGWQPERVPMSWPWEGLAHGQPSPSLSVSIW